MYLDDFFHFQFFIYNEVISTAYTLLDLPPDLQWLLQFIIENTFSLSSAMELLNQTDSQRNPIWGKISNAVNGRNRPLLRKKIYLKWVRNVSKIQDYANKHFEAVSIHPKLNVSVPASNKNRPKTCQTEQVRPVYIIQPPQWDTDSSVRGQFGTDISVRTFRYGTFRYGTFRYGTFRYVDISVS